MAYWLIKSEPDVYGIQVLARDRTTIWDGVRNYQARNFLKAMAVGDLAFFYHSNDNPPGIVGLARVIEANVLDPTQFNPESDYFDARSTPEKPRWHTARFEYVETFETRIALAMLREMFTVEELVVVRPGNRLSVMPVSDAAAEKILHIARS